MADGVHTDTDEDREREPTFYASHVTWIAYILCQVQFTISPDSYQVSTK